MQDNDDNDKLNDTRPDQAKEIKTSHLLLLLFNTRREATATNTHQGREETASNIKHEDCTNRGKSRHSETAGEPRGETLHGSFVVVHLFTQDAMPSLPPFGTPHGMRPGHHGNFPSLVPESVASLC